MKLENIIKTTALATMMAGGAYAKDTHAAICDADEKKVHYSHGVDAVVDDMPGGPEYLGLPGGGPAVPAYTDTFFLTEENDEFFLDIITYDHENNTIVTSPIGEGGNTRRHPGDVTADGNGGDILYEMCVPETWKGGLSITVYEHQTNGNTLSFFTNAVHPREGHDGKLYGLAVANEAGSSAIGGSFNAGTGPNSDAEIFTRLLTGYFDDILDANGVNINYDLSRSAAENAITLYQVGLTEKPMRGQAFLHNADGAFIEGNTAIITSNTSDAYVPDGVASVHRTNGTRADSNGRVDLDALLSEKILWQRTDYGKIPFMILDGRGDVSVNVDGQNVQAGFVNIGGTDRVLELKNGSTVIERAVNDDLDTTLNEGSYTIESYRVSPQGHRIAERTQTVNIGSTPELVEILGLNYDTDAHIENPAVNGSLADIVNLNCDEQIGYAFETEPAGSYTWSDNAPAWASITGNGNLNGTPSGNDCGATHTFTYTVNGPNNSDSVDVTYDVAGEAQEEIRIIGIDGDGDGEIDWADADKNGVLDTVIDISCSAPAPYEHTLIVEPEGNYTAFGQSLPPNMVLSQGLLKITFDPTCEQAENTYIPSFTVSNGIVESNSLDIQYRVQ